MGKQGEGGGKPRPYYIRDTCSIAYGVLYHIQINKNFLLQSGQRNIDIPEMFLNFLVL